MLSIDMKCIGLEKAEDMIHGQNECGTWGSSLDVTTSIEEDRVNANRASCRVDAESFPDFLTKQPHSHSACLASLAAAWATCDTKDTVRPPAEQQPPVVEGPSSEPSSQLIYHRLFWQQTAGPVPISG